MKATGIVRRIDDLGRVVIPKEIRRTLHIRVGEPLEIFVTGEGEVIFKKYSPLGDLWTVAGRYAEVLAKTAAAPVLICDRDHVITSAGFPKKDCVDKPLCAAFEDIMENRRLYIADGIAPAVFEDGLVCAAAAPILCRGDVAGAVVLLPGDAPADETAGKLLTTAAAFFGKTLED